MLSTLNAADAIELYKSIGNKDQADLILNSNTGSDLEGIQWPWNRPVPAWEHTNYSYGFVASDNSATSVLPIKDARNITADLTLKNSKITISLDKLKIYEYPGKGIHNVLFKFSAQNHVTSADENLSFNQTFQIQEGENAAIEGYPIFVGLNIGTELVQFNVQIINVSNDNDDKILDTLNGDTFKSGLKLIGTLNPVIPVITQYATGIANMILSRNNNVDIHAPSMGLYFAGQPLQAKLAIGSYIAVQNSDPAAIDWNKWQLNINTGEIEAIDGSSSNLPYNYFVFSIGKSS